MDGSYRAFGRFLLKEQPAGGRTGILPCGSRCVAEKKWYGDLDTISEEEASLVYGYWIARVTNGP